jgi:hypothetical protein
MDEPSSISHGPIFFICTNRDSILYQEFDILCLVNQLKLPINFLWRLCSPFTKKKNPWIIHIHARDYPCTDIRGFDHPSWALKESAQLDWWEMNNTKDARYQRGE